MANNSVEDRFLANKVPFFVMSRHVFSSFSRDGGGALRAPPDPPCTGLEVCVSSSLARSRRARPWILFTSHAPAGTIVQRVWAVGESDHQRNWNARQQRNWNARQVQI